MSDVFESVIDVGSGFILAILIQMFVFPLFDLHPTIFENFQIPGNNDYFPNKNCM